MLPANKKIKIKKKTKESLLDKRTIFGKRRHKSVLLETRLQPERPKQRISKPLWLHFHSPTIEIGIQAALLK